MNVENETKKLTIALPLTEVEREALAKATKTTGLIKQFYIRNLVINDLKKNGWLPQESEGKGN